MNFADGAQLMPNAHPQRLYKRLRADMPPTKLGINLGIMA
jgi:hypothetical protein